MTRVFAEASSLEALLEELAGARVSTLRIAASDYLGEALLLPVMQRLFAKRVPLRFEITTTNSAAAGRLVGQGQVDLAVVSVAQGADAESEPPLLRQPFCWVAPRRRRGRGGAVTTRLAREPLLRLTPGSLGRRMLDEYLGRTRVRPVSTIDLPSVSLMLSYAARGLGIGLVPALALERVDRHRVAVERAAVPDVSVRLLPRAALDRSGAVGQFLERLVVEGRKAQARLEKL
jgi:DNA-binding transcriptional LysR family regulator